MQEKTTKRLYPRWDSNHRSPDTFPNELTTGNELTRVFGSSKNDYAQASKKYKALNLRKITQRNFSVQIL